MEQLIYFIQWHVAEVALYQYLHRKPSPPSSPVDRLARRVENKQKDPMLCSGPILLAPG